MYIGQCDILRKTFQGEDNWQKMMQERLQIPLEMALALCDLSVLCDPDETPQQLLDYWVEQDAMTSAFRSNWGPHRCIFFQTCGFEFIFRSE